MTMQRIKYFNKTGDPCDMILQIIKKQSKYILVRNPEDNHEFTIPRIAVESIEEAPIMVTLKEFKENERRFDSSKI